MGEPVSYRSFVGIGLEATPGTPVQSQVELDFISESLRGQGEPIRRRSINRKRAVKGAVMGPYSAEGDLNVEATPDKLTKLIYATLTNLATSGSADPYTHVFKTGDTLKSVTAQVQRDDVYFVYPGLYVARLSFRGVIDQILEATFGLQGRAQERLYNAEQSDAGITSSSEDPFVFHGATVSLDGTANTDTNNWELTLDTGLFRGKGLGAGRAHNRAHPGDSQVTGSFDVVFDDVTEHRRWMGAASNTYPIVVADTLQTLALQLKYATPSGRELILEIPKAYYSASEPSVQGREGVIIQRLQFASLWDATANSDVVLTLKNGETGINITQAGTAIA